MKKLVIIALSLSTLVLAGCGNSSSSPYKDGELDSFAQCLTDAGIKMYGTEWCPHCQNQKKQFGTSFSKVSYIDCDKQKVQCEVAKIEGYPTWIYKGTQYQGEQKLEKLAELTSCQLPSPSNQ